MVRILSVLLCIAIALTDQTVASAQGLHPSDSLAIASLEAENDSEHYRVVYSVNDSGRISDVWVTGTRYSPPPDVLYTIPETIAGLDSLKTLKFNYVNFKSEPDAIGLLTGLTQLLCNYCHYSVKNGVFEAIPESWKVLKKLEVLTLTRTGIVSIPTWIGELDSLVQLEISDGVLRGAIPKEIWHMKSLKRLYLPRNGLSSINIPDSGRVVPIGSLNIENNRIEEIPEEVAQRMFGNPGGTGFTIRAKNNRLRSIPVALLNRTDAYSLGVRGNLIYCEGPPSEDIQQLIMRAGTKINGLDRQDCSYLSLNEGEYQFLREFAEINQIPEPPELLDRTTTDGRITEFTYFGDFHTVPASIAHLDSLLELKLSTENLLSLPDEIGQLKELRSLTLWGTGQLTSLPESIGELTNLETLSLHNTGLTHLPERIGELTNLKVLEIQNANLTTLPESILQLTSLTELRLTQNKLTHLPDTFGNLEHLQWLNLSGNYLTSLPESIFKPGGTLIRVSINGNKLSSLPLDISGLTKIRAFSVSENAFTEYPTQISQLPWLNFLSIANNAISEIPASIGAFPFLTELHLAGNQISHIPPEIGLLKNLRELDISENQLEDLPQEMHSLSLNIFLAFSNEFTAIPDVVYSMRSLRDLGLGGAKINTVDSRIGDLTGLQGLWLSTNQISTLPESIGRLSKLRILQLHENKLSNLPDSLASLHNLTTLSLSGNVLYCSNGTVDNSLIPSVLTNGSIANLSGLTQQYCAFGTSNEQLDPIPDLEESAVFPNPFESQLVVQPKSEGKSFQIDLFDLLGRRIAQSGQLLPNTKWVYDGQHLAPGMYLVRILFDTGAVDTKPVVKL